MASEVKKITKRQAWRHRKKNKTYSQKGNHNFTTEEKENQEKMASGQSMIQAITQTVFEVTKAAIMGMRKAECPTKSRSPAHELPRASGPSLSQHFTGKHKICTMNLNNFKNKLRNIFMGNSFNTEDSDSDNYN